MSTSDQIAAKQIIGAQIVTGTLNELHARQQGKIATNPFKLTDDKDSIKDTIGGDIISQTINSTNAMRAGLNSCQSGKIINNKG